MKVTIPTIGAAGVIKDVPAHELPPSALTDVQNVRVRDGRAERITGDRAVFAAPSAAPYGMWIYSTASKNFVVHAQLGAVFADDGSANPATRTDITGTAPTGAASDKWTGGTLGGVLVINNGKDKPMYWGGDTSANLATLTNWDTDWTCKVLRPFKNYLVALDVTKTSTRYPHMVKWSAAAEPGTLPTWDETDPSTDAGEVDLAETSDPMIDAVQLGDSLIIFKKASAYAMTYIGGAFIFQFRKLPVIAGMLAPNCGAQVPGGLVVLSAGDVVFFDGTQATSILTGKLREWMFANIDSENYTRSFVVANPQLNEAWICFPMAGSTSCDKAIIWNYKENTLSLRDLDGALCAASGPFLYVEDTTWSGDSETWAVDQTSWTFAGAALAQNSLLIGTDAPQIALADTGGTMGGATHPCKMERTGLAFDKPDTVKLISAVVPRVDAPAGTVLSIQVGATNDPEGDYSWSDAVTYTVGTTRKADAMASGRFLAYRISSTGGEIWKVRSIDLEVKELGAY